MSIVIIVRRETCTYINRKKNIIIIVPAIGLGKRICSINDNTKNIILWIFRFLPSTFLPLIPSRPLMNKQLSFFACFTFFLRHPFSFVHPSQKRLCRLIKLEKSYSLSYVHSTILFVFLFSVSDSVVKIPAAPLSQLPLLYCLAFNRSFINTILWWLFSLSSSFSSLWK